MPTQPDDVEFRQVEPEQYPEYREIVDYAFHPAEGPREYDGPADVPDRIADRYGLFDGGDLVSICAHYDFEARLRGDWVPLAGLAAVATPPEHRRRGHVSALVDASLRQWRGEYPFAALWPFERAYYEQFGWATANERVAYSVPPDQLAFARDRAGGTVRRLAPDDWTALRDVYEAHAADRGLSLRRNEDWWRRRVFRSLDGKERYVYAWERDGTVRGYVAYTIDEADDGRTLSVRDLAFREQEAYLVLLGLLADHDSQVETVTLRREVETTLLDLVEDPSAVDCEVTPGPMVRIVDVERALETGCYPPDTAADVTLRVTDDTAPWNDGLVRLQVADGEGNCERIGGADAPDEPDARLDIGTLSQLAVGYQGVPTARRIATLDVSDERTAETLAALFPPETVYLRDFF